MALASGTLGRTMAARTSGGSWKSGGRSLRTVASSGGRMSMGNSAALGAARARAARREWSGVAGPSRRCGAWPDRAACRFAPEEPPCGRNNHGVTSMSGSRRILHQTKSCKVVASPSRRPDKISGFVYQKVACDGAFVGCFPSTEGGPAGAGAQRAPYGPPPRRRLHFAEIVRPDLPRRSVNPCFPSDPRSVVVRGCEATGSSAMMLGVGIRRGPAPGRAISGTRPGRRPLKDSRTARRDRTGPGDVPAPAEGRPGRHGRRSAWPGSDWRCWSGRAGARGGCCGDAWCCRWRPTWGW